MELTVESAVKSLLTKFARAVPIGTPAWMLQGQPSRG